MQPWKAWFVALVLMITGIQAWAGEVQTPEELVRDDVTLSPVLLLPPKRWQAAAEQAQRTPGGQALRSQLLARARQWVGGQPAPVQTLVYEGRLEKDPARVQTKLALLDMQKLRDLACAYAITGEDAYGAAGNRFLMAWVETCQITDNPINMNKLALLVAAFPLLQDQLALSQRQTAQRWLSQLAALQVQGIGHSKANWESKRFKLIALIGAALGDKALAERGIAGLKEWIQHDLRPDGRSLDLEERDALSYHLGGIVPVLEVAVAVAPLGVDLYDYQAPGGASLHQSVAWVVPYARGEKIYPQWRNSKVPLDRQRWEAGDEHYRPGRPWEPAEGLVLFQLAGVLDPTLRPLAAELEKQTAQPEARWIRLFTHQP